MSALDRPSAAARVDTAPVASRPTLRVENLSTHFFTRAGVIKAVSGVSLTVAAGEVVGLVGVVAAVTRANAGQLAALPSIVAIVVGILLLRLLARRAEAAHGDPAPSSESRRRFLVAAGVSAGLGVLAIVGGRMLTAGQRATQTVRTAFKLPTPTTGSG